MRSDKKYPQTEPSQDFSGWIWMLSGLGVGLIIATAIYLNNRGETGEVSSYLSNQKTPENYLEPAPKVAVESEVTVVKNPFTFYSILLKENPQISSETNSIRVVNQTDEDSSDLDILQVGAFEVPADAERMRKDLALLDIESSIQKITIDSKDYHRVIIGPIGKISELNSLQKQLEDADIEVYRRKRPD